MSDRSPADTLTAAADRLDQLCAEAGSGPIRAIAATYSTSASLCSSPSHWSVAILRERAEARAFPGSGVAPRPRHPRRGQP